MAETATERFSRRTEELRQENGELRHNLNTIASNLKDFEHPLPCGEGPCILCWLRALAAGEVD